eukprot:CAMPEP_0194150210 /NCGR_PEP_ID=MMETSP0152-20130528/42070_1 /TAXON_ID=1049557 /ORGANISM="Thalassiothrix antarctica, Strain L6-D1" /LENGTH=436 /DNA_ID=CAMNT_0038852965 /DNA_START=46 /DNA_END=1356 /DNA_ORIENTATION=-
MRSGVRRKNRSYPEARLHQLPPNSGMANKLKRSTLVMLTLAVLNGIFVLKMEWTVNETLGVNGDSSPSINGSTEFLDNKSSVLESQSIVVPSEKVEWVHDNAWFDTQVQKGCCPFAVQMYQHRYSDVEHRCCTTRAIEGKIKPLRTVGGLDYSQIPPGKKLTALIQGDSLGEQHFLGMICYAWYSDGLRVELKHLEVGKYKEFYGDGELWQADIFRSMHGDTNNGRSTINEGKTDEQLIVTIQYFRCNKPTVVNITELTNINNKNYSGILRSPDFYVLGGWHHGGISIPQFKKIVHQVVARPEAQQEESKPIIQSSRVILVDSLPSHFPGGNYINDDKLYPPAKGDNEEVYGNDKVCDKNSFKGNPNINNELSAMVQNQTNNSVLLLKVSKLYYRRGDAHAEVNGFGSNKRDCLHWCIAPGVMDALTKMTLAAFLA